MAWRRPGANVLMQISVNENLKVDYTQMAVPHFSDLQHG